jgi:hypothetical protein
VYAKWKSRKAIELHKFYFKRFHMSNYKKSRRYKTPTEAREGLEAPANKKGYK